MATHEDLSRATHENKAGSKRGFGWVFTAGFAVIALWPLVSGHAIRWWALIVAAVFLVITLLAPALLALPNRLWSKLGALLNRMASPLVLLFLFYVVVTPMGMLKRRMSKKSMRHPNVTDGSYWIKRNPPGPAPQSLDRQF